MYEVYLIITKVDGKIVKKEICDRYNTPENPPYTIGGKRHVIYKTRLCRSLIEAINEAIDYCAIVFPDE
jgi:hypothetical protein